MSTWIPKGRLLALSFARGRFLLLHICRPEHGASSRFPGFPLIPPSLMAGSWFCTFHHRTKFFFAYQRFLNTCSGCYQTSVHTLLCASPAVFLSLAALSDATLTCILLFGDALSQNRFVFFSDQLRTTRVLYTHVLFTSNSTPSPEVCA